MDPADLWKLLDLPGARGATQTGVLIFARLVPLVTLTPVFGGEMMPKRLRLGLTVVLTVALLPAFVPTFQHAVAWLPFVALLAKEAVVGLTLSMFVLVVFETAAAVGALVDQARGATLANVFDPLTQQQQSILAVLFMQVAIVLFLSVGGLQLLMRALGDSFAVVPPHDLVPGGRFAPPAAGPMIDLVADLFVIAFRLAAPAVVVIFLLDLALGVINRVAPQIQVYFLSLTAKGSLALLLMLLALGFTVDLLVEHFGQSMQALQQWLHALPGATGMPGV